LTVHAHPDDESSKGGATVAHYAGRGVRCVLVSCTGGEAGAAPVGVGAEELASVRARELRDAAVILGYETTHLLGYQDSGMDGTAPDGFASAPLDRVVGELVTIIQRERPDVVVTYDAEYAARHPDHRRGHEAASDAFERAATADWHPLKLYGCRTHSPGRLRAMHDWLISAGRPSPYADALARSAASVDPTTTRVDVSIHLAVAQRALQAHASQVAADDPWFFSVPLDVMRRIYPYDDYSLLRSRVACAATNGAIECDLFDGIDDLLTP
jgi:mycothiol S-conjugate amidase